MEFEAGQVFARFEGTHQGTAILFLFIFHLISTAFSTVFPVLCSQIVVSDQLNFF